ncbi:DUF5753 domain-containing protein [Streptomyces sp. MCAF7]
MPSAGPLPGRPAAVLKTAVHRALPPGRWTAPGVALAPRPRGRRPGPLTSATPVGMWAIVHESVLRHTIGSAKIMRAQFERMLDVARLKNVTLQVLPFDADSYPAVAAFTILGFPDQEDPDMVYRDGLTDAVYLESPEEIALYGKAFDNLRALSLSPQRSSDLIRQAAQGLC